MKCVRCQAEYSDGQNHCPVCGSAQRPTFHVINIKELSSPRSAKKRRLTFGTIFPMISVALAFAFITIYVPQLQRDGKKSEYNGILSEYKNLSESETIAALYKKIFGDYNRLIPRLESADGGTPQDADIDAAESLLVTMSVFFTQYKSAPEANDAILLFKALYSLTEPYFSKDERTDLIVRSYQSIQDITLPNSFSQSPAERLLLKMAQFIQDYPGTAEADEIFALYNELLDR